MTTPPAKHSRVRFGALLREYRNAQHVTQHALGRHVGVSPDAVATWEKGRSLPDEATVRLLDARLQADGRLRQARREADIRTDRPTSTGPALSADSLLASSAQDAADFGSWAEIVNAGAVTITTVTNRVRALADLALAAPPMQIISEAAEINHTLFGILRGHHKPGHGRDGYIATGVCNAILCWLAGDFGNLDAAEIHGATAQTCADMAENPELTAWVYVVRSKTAFWARNYLVAANLARAGAAAAYGAPGTAAVMLACQQADAWAKLGAAEEAARALDEADRAASTQHGVDSLGGLFTCGPGRALNYAAGANNEIARHAQAQTAADAALAVFARDPAYGFGTVAQTHVTKTLAYANAGDLDAAAVAARPVLDLPPERRLATVKDRLRPLARALTAPSLNTSRVAAPLREEITAFCRDSGQRAIGTGAGAR